MSERAPSAAGLGCATLVDLLRARAAEQPERTAYTFLRDGQVEEAPLTYRELDAQARAIAAHLQAQGAAGERALLLFPPGLEFVSAFFGCLYAGVVAVPAYPPRTNRPDPRIQEIVSDAQARFALTTGAVKSALAASAGETPGLRSLNWVATDEVPLDTREQWRETSVEAGTLAFLQYTSGSTKAPKGVMVTHGNVLQNDEDLRQIMRHGPDSISVSWLPHFHDMGLVWGILQPLYSGFPGYLMPPASFIQQPVRWLQAISTYKATHSGGPNFAYELCASRVTPEQRALLDLGSWRVAFNGAEPVRKATLVRFAEAFGPCGFRWQVLAPCYGMAEATLMVTFSRRDEGYLDLRVDADELQKGRVVEAADGAEARALVGCGRSEGVRRLAIVDPQSLSVAAPGHVGEIWAAGPNIARGYWNRPEQTVSTFGAFLGNGEGPFLRTGDLGFQHGGELFVTGRVKDLIIIRGLNHYPQDIEATVERSHPALQPSAGAAFSIESGDEERLVVVHEVDRHHVRSLAVDEVVEAIRRAVTEEHEVEPWAVALIRPATILKTSSGKIQRQGCRAAFLAGSLSTVGEWRKPEVEDSLPTQTPAAGARTESDITGWLVARLARESGIDADEIDLAQPFASFGLDSARSLMLVGDLENWLGRRLSPVVLWNYPTVESLARHLGE